MLIIVLTAVKELAT